MNSACARLSTVVFLALQYFSTLSHKQNDFREKVTEHKVRVFISLQLLFGIFLILRKIQRDIINAYWCSEKKTPVILNRF
jgi:hypothetical protein